MEWTRTVAGWFGGKVYTHEPHKDEEEDNEPRYGHRGDISHCARCSSENTTATEIFNGGVWYLCYNCREKFYTFRYSNKTFLTFEQLHEPYIMIKRRGCTVEEAMRCADSKEFKEMIARLSSLRLEMQTEVQEWIRNESETE